MMTYLSNVFASWSGFMTPVVILAVILGLVVYVGMTVTRNTSSPEVQAYRAQVNKYRSTAVKAFLAIAAALLLLALVMPGNTPKRDIRVEPTLQQKQQRNETLRSTGSQELRVIESPGSNPERELRQRCREARQGYREMDMSKCEGID